MIRILAILSVLLLTAAAWSKPKPSVVPKPPIAPAVRADLPCGESGCDCGCAEGGVCTCSQKKKSAYDGWTLRDDGCYYKRDGEYWLRWRPDTQPKEPPPGLIDKPIHVAPPVSGVPWYDSSPSIQHRTQQPSFQSFQSFGGFSGASCAGGR